MIVVSCLITHVSTTSLAYMHELFYDLAIRTASAYPIHLIADPDPTRRVVPARRPDGASCEALERIP